MKSRDCILLALLTVLIVVLVCQGRGKSCRKDERRENLVSSPGPADMWVKASLAPYTAIQNAVDIVRGNPDAKDILMQGRPAFKAFTKSSGDIKPEDMMAAERAAWVTAAEQDRIAPYNVEKMSDPAQDTMQHFEPSPAIDYQTMITDLVVDPRTRMNHSEWVNEMQGWSGTTTMKVDILEPELYLDWNGLRMPQAGVGQYNPLQLTEVDDTDLAKNKPFNFNG